MNQVSLAKIVFVGALAAAVSLAIACGSGHPPVGAPGDNANDPTACATEGAFQDCHTTVSSSNGIVNCMLGVQQCVGGHWAACGGGDTKTARYVTRLTSGASGAAGLSLAPSMGPGGSGAGGVHILGDPTLPAQDAGLCNSDPCDPYCYGWSDVGMGAPAPTCTPTYAGTYNAAGLPGGAQINSATCSVTPGTGDGNCSYDQCCAVAGAPCVDFGSATTGRCAAPPAGDAFGNVGQTGGGNCAAGVDYTAGVACDVTPGGDTVVTICNRGGVADTSHKLNVGIHGGGNPTYPFVSNPGCFATHAGCEIDFGAVSGGLQAGTCGVLNFNQGTWNGSNAGVDCSSLGFNAFFRGFCLNGDAPILLNGGGSGGTGNFGAQNKSDVKVPECNSANNWTFSHHETCVVAGGGCGAGSGSAGSLPPGWYSGATTSPCVAPAAPGDCQFDQCCPVTGGACADWASAAVTGNCAPLTNNLAATCATQPDYTAQVGCNDPITGDTIIPICNRGGVAAPTTAGSKLVFALQDDKYNPGNSNFPFNAGRGTCTIDLTVPTNALPPGTCIPVDINAPQAGITCNSIHVEGQNSIFVNGGGPNGTATSAANIGQPECTGANNWTAINNQTCSTATAAGTPLLTCGAVSALPGPIKGLNGGPCHPGGGLGQCLFDQCCYKNGNNDCRDWDTTNNGDCDSNAYCTGKIDFTASAGCVDVNGDTHIQICNRGDIGAAAGTMNVGFAATDSGADAPRSYNFTSAGGCTFSIAAIGGLDHDACIDLDVNAQTVDGQPVNCSSMLPTPAAFINAGPRTVRVNTTAVTGVASTGDNNNGIVECGGGNNWTATIPGTLCTGCPVTQTGAGGGTYTYTGICDPGSHVRWKYFIYDVTIAGGKNVEFDASTVLTLPDGTVQAPSASYTLANPPTLPTATSCIYQQPAVGGCPVDLASILGPIDSLGQVLTLVVNPSGASSALDWGITYDCIPYE